MYSTRQQSTLNRCSFYLLSPLGSHSAVLGSNVDSWFTFEALISLPNKNSSLFGELMKCAPCLAMFHLKLSEGILSTLWGVGVETDMLDYSAVSQRWCADTGTERCVWELTFIPCQVWAVSSVLRGCHCWHGLVGNRVSCQNSRKDQCASVLSTRKLSASNVVL